MSNLQINDRIGKLIKVLNKNPNSFAESLGVSAPVVYNIIKGRRSKPSYDLIQKIISMYEVNASWLLVGKGQMWQNKEEEEKKEREIPEPVSKQLERRIVLLLDQLEENSEDNYQVMELKDLFAKLMFEHNNVQAKMIVLYEKQERLMDVLREKLGVRV